MALQIQFKCFVFAPSVLSSVHLFVGFVMTAKGRRTDLANILTVGTYTEYTYLFFGRFRAVLSHFSAVLRSCSSRFRSVLNRFRTVLHGLNTVFSLFRHRRRREVVFVDRCRRRRHRRRRRWPFSLGYV